MDEQQATIRNESFVDRMRDLAEEAAAGFETMRESIALDRPHRMFLVRGGSVEVYAVPWLENHQVGAHVHLFTVPEGGVLFGLADTGGCKLIAIPSKGGAIAELGADPFWREAAKPSFRRGAAAAVGAWISALLEARIEFGGIAVAANSKASPGRETVVANGESITAPRGILWARGDRGTGTWLDGRAFEGEVPIVPGVAISGTSRLRISVRDGEAVLESGALAAAAANAGAEILSSIGDELNRRIVDETSRVRERQRRQAADRQDTVNELLGLVDGRVAGATALDDDSALFASVSLIAARMNVEARYPHGLRRADSEKTLLDILAASELRRRRVRLSDGWWRRESEEMLAFRKRDGRPVAVIREGSRFEIVDPAGGARMRLTAEAAAGLNETAYVFFKALPNRPIGYRDLLAFGQHDRRRDIAVFLVCALIGALLGAAPPLAVAFIIVSVLPLHLSGFLMQIGVALVAVALAGAMITVVGNIAILRIESRVESRVKAALWDRLLRAPAETLARFTAGNLFSRIAVLEVVHLRIRNSLYHCVFGASALIVSIAVIFLFNLLAGIVAAALFALLAAVVAAIVFGKRDGFRNDQVLGHVESAAVELTASVRKIRLAGASDRVFARWARRFRDLHAVQIRVIQASDILRTLLSGFTLIAAAILYSVITVFNPEPVTAAAFASILTAYGVAISAAAVLGEAAMTIAIQSIDIGHGRPLLALDPERPGQKIRLGRLAGRVEVDNLSFGYAESAEPVLRDISFSVEPGEFVVIAGATGSGKSTVLRLLLGLDEPDFGAVLIDGRDIRSLDMTAVRRQIGGVLQPPVLLANSLRDNIRGVADIAVDEIWRAAELAGVADEIRAMPKQLDTPVSDGTTSLSAGQVQRVALARAMAGTPPILVLDDATSALDSETQGMVLEGLFSIAATKIVATNRAGVMREADRILVLDRGRIAKSGTFAELTAAGGPLEALAD